MTDYTSPLRSAADLEDRVRQIGFLPYFRNRIPGLSVEEMTPSNILWDKNGPWEWKGDIARGMTSAYGKFFHGKAGYVSREWLADFTNYRRWCAPLENAIPDSLGNNVDAIILDILSLNGPMRSTDLRNATGFQRIPRKQYLEMQEAAKASADKEKAGKRGKATSSRKDVGFDTRMTRLQMAGRVVITDFTHNIDRHGNPYGFGIACYDTPENRFGPEVLDCQGRSPMESFSRMLSHLRQQLPYIPANLLSSLLGVPRHDGRLRLS